MAKPNPNETYPYPPSSEIWFCFGQEDLFGLPGFLLLRFVLDSQPKAEQDDHEYEALARGNTLMDLSDASLIAYLQEYVKWGKIEPFITLPPDSRARLAELWQQKKTSLDNYSVHVRPKRGPSELFRYTKCSQDWLQQLFAENKLYLMPPAKLNDPFDNPRCGIVCFSEKKDNVLMFSHYADGHRGMCFGVNPVELTRSLEDLQRKDQQRVKADIRPVWYFNREPPLDFRTQPVLLDTRKHDVWSYEKEYRLFLLESQRGRWKPLPGDKHYQFSADSLTSVIFGCRASDECISLVKSIMHDRPDIKYYKAHQEPNRFGVELREIVKL